MHLSWPGAYTPPASIPAQHVPVVAIVAPAPAVVPITAPQSSTPNVMQATTPQPPSPAPRLYSRAIPEEYAATQQATQLACLKAVEETEAIQAGNVALHKMVTVVFWVKSGPPKYFKITSLHTTYFTPSEHLVLLSAAPRAFFIAVLNNYLDGPIQGEGAWTTQDLTIPVRILEAQDGQGFRALIRLDNVEIKTCQQLHEEASQIPLLLQSRQATRSLPPLPCSTYWEAGACSSLSDLSDMEKGIILYKSSKKQQQSAELWSELVNEVNILKKQGLLSPVVSLSTSATVHDLGTIDNEEPVVMPPMKQESEVIELTDDDDDNTPDCQIQEVHVGFYKKNTETGVYKEHVAPPDQKVQLIINMSDDLGHPYGFKHVYLGFMALAQGGAPQAGKSTFNLDGQAVVFKSFRPQAGPSLFGRAWWTMGMCYAEACQICEMFKRLGLNKNIDDMFDFEILPVKTAYGMGEYLIMPQVTSRPLETEFTCRVGNVYAMLETFSHYVYTIKGGDLLYSNFQGRFTPTSKSLKIFDLDIHAIVDSELEVFQATRLSQALMTLQWLIFATTSVITWAFLISQLKS
ncbi:hypothetical protein DXG01_002277 [Tephrocybe rancida]|nr:hypothetical protein DXG01_002277 [Tephrocybe rancida]